MAESIASHSAVITLEAVTTRFGDKVVHDRIDFEVARGEILALVGASGSGKSVLLREMALLHPVTSGKIHVLGVPLSGVSETEAMHLRRRMGILFQDGALFGNMTVLENISMPLREHTKLSNTLIDEIAVMKLILSGLTPDSGRLYPSQLSGGMRKRAAVARAIALDPELLFLDEPTSGLDPVSADAFDDLILELKQALGLTVVMVTHDINALWRVTDRVVLLGMAKVLGIGTMQALSSDKNPDVKCFFQRCPENVTPK